MIAQRPPVRGNELLGKFQLVPARPAKPSYEEEIEIYRLFRAVR